MRKGLIHIIIVFGNTILSKSIEKNGAKAIKSRLDVEPKKHVSPKLIGLFLSDGTIFVTIHMLLASNPKAKRNLYFTAKVTCKKF